MDEARVAALKAAGVSEDEIQGLKEQIASKKVEDEVSAWEKKLIAASASEKKTMMLEKATDLMCKAAITADYVEKKAYRKTAQELRYAAKGATGYVSF
jgi:hypothetical protein